MKNSTANLAIAGAAFIALGTPEAARAVTIDFDSLAAPDSDFTLVGRVYREDGYIVRSGSQRLTAVNPIAPTYNGSPSLFNNRANAITTLTRNRGESFKLESIDLDWINSAAFTSDVPVTFNGTKSNDSVVSRTFNLDLNQGLQTFRFGGRFNNLQSVSWEQEPDFHQFDNIVASEVPEPLTIFGSLAALGMGMALKREYSRKQQSTVSE